ncbi:UDP-N-acetylglucosamine transferase subunit ALG13 [Mycetocola sp. CAN_C7]
MNAGGTVVVSAGTYHLPFHRLSEWMQPWADAHPEVRIVMQHGPGSPVRGAENHGILPYDELLELYGTAEAIVLQGGAGGIMDMRALGRVPIVVPRIPVDDEVVDDHQLLFTEEMAELGLIHRVTTRDDLWSRLDGAVAGSLVTHVDHAEATPGVEGVAGLLTRPPRKLDARVRFRRQIAAANLILHRHQSA